MNYKQKAGERIVKARERKGWSPQQLAAESGLLYKRLDHYEKGRRQIAPAEVMTLSKVLGVRPGYLMGLEDSNVLLNDTEEALVKNWRILSEKDRMEYFRKLQAAALQSRDPAPDNKVGHALGQPPKIRQGTHGKK